MFRKLQLILAGIIGLVLIRYQRITRNKVRENCFIFLRADSIIVVLLVLVLCSVAFVTTSMHLCRLKANDTKCIATNLLEEHGSCTCTFNMLDSELSKNITNTTEEVVDSEDNSYSHEYRYDV